MPVLDADVLGALLTTQTPVKVDWQSAARPRQISPRLDADASCEAGSLTVSLEEALTRRIILFAALLALTGDAAFAQAPTAAVAMHPVVMTLSSPDLVDGGVLPDQFTSKVNVQGQPPKAVSPALNWTGTPAGTQSFVLVMHDLDVIVGKTTGDNLHWLAFNIPGTATSLPQGVPTTPTLADGTIQPRNRTSNGFQGPGAPAPIYHHYVFELWALDSKLPLDANASRDEVMKAMDGHVLDKGVLVGRFHR